MAASKYLRSLYPDEDNIDSDDMCTTCGRTRGEHFSTHCLSKATLQRNPDLRDTVFAQIPEYLQVSEGL